jgi:hypothetical protein
MCKVNLKKISGNDNSRADNPTLKKAMSRSDWLKWEIAINNEYQQLLDDGVINGIKVNKIPKGTHIIGSMLVLTIERFPDGRIDKYKARLVALGNQQTSDSYDAIKSGTVRTSTVKMLISIQAKVNAYSMVLDVKGEYLKSFMNELDKGKMFIKYPNGSVYELYKYIYGLKQSGLEWQKNITKTLTKLGYHKSRNDPLVFFYRKSTDFVIMTLYVDDFYVISNRESFLYRLHGELEGVYGTVSMTMGNDLAYLGMRIVRNDDKTVFISQPGYAKKLCDAFLEADDRLIAKTPMMVNESERCDDSQLVDQTNFMRIVGGINYLAQCTRPDILYAISRSAQACSSPNKGDLRRVMRLLRYVLGTVEKGVKFNHGIMRLMCHVDASFNLYEDGRSHYGYSFSLGNDDGAFYAKSQRMKLQPLSSTEAEYVALCEAGRDIVYIRRILVDIGYGCNEPTIVYEDNKSTIEMVMGNMRHKSSKHINPKYHYTVLLAHRGIILMVHKITELMIADIFTKALGWILFKSLREYLLNE